ncbi:FecCD family ABC transporter permease [Cellulosimicrobium arenosum]|uniref:Iron chelate uptake ABC transporter family permease subunit n=1 Tax=Cellulosimicrobium arenosum TaxID=2708133 RepID=A0A927J1A3_9MICO|nr:iron chelate uptake ABC transporter family permease subunit [Cellulosimicrobium arenosum]MBD8080032.1 iron chelate uptake ABC transporter family permease subunit [Cellulosimicrobium arenosum]
MSTTTPAAPARADRRPGLVHTFGGRSLGLLVALVVVVAAVALSLAVGSKQIPLGTVVDALTAYDGSADHVVVHDLRVPRTLLGLLVGAALGVSGALIQGMTRNPLADPGILGVNAGAGFGVVLSVALLGATQASTFVWFAFAGAIVATVAVYLVGSQGRGGATPVRLTLAGIALGAFLGGLTLGVTLLDPSAFDRLRAWGGTSGAWGSGSIAGATPATVGDVAPFILCGLLLALLISRPLDAVALGDDLAASLGAHVGRTRLLVGVAITLMCGAATAGAGPVAFVGLMVPHVARWTVGPVQRWIVPYSALLGAVLVLVSDVLGRVVARPGEVPVGIITAFVGAPVLIALVRRTRMSGL